ncbi:MAG: AAA family ATPase [Candidatus Pacebacteria bacterium]|nr:AAA family ATPase [Candidatus Paceibacterota bacterium]
METKSCKCQNCGLTSESFFIADAKNFRKNISRITEGEIGICSLCNNCYSKRKDCLEAIINTAKDKKIIVAGPGTGKTHTFGELLKQLPAEGRAIVFTLINNLVFDLKKELSSIGNNNIKATTFHGFCREMLHSKIHFKPGFEYFPKLTKLICADADLLSSGFSKEDFDKSFANLDENKAMEFYLERADYYNSASHNDAVFKIYNFLKENTEEIPEYEIAIADEYQDFNLLESSFINLLATKNKILIAGDDDQALYKFRFAEKKFIRDLRKNTDFQFFPLPFCSRCSPVLVDATNYFVKKAQMDGLLKERIPRDYLCYWPDKYIESINYPKIFVAHCSTAKTMNEFIVARIQEIKQAESIDGTEKDIQFLIIGPESGYHINNLAVCLKEKLDGSIYEIQTAKEKEALTIDEGYSIIQRGNNNLGWRIVMELDPIDGQADIINRSYEAKAGLEGLLPVEYIEKHQTSISGRAGIADENVCLSEDELPEENNNRKIKIRMTNFYGSKGLTALHVFVIGLNNRTFPKNPDNIKDDEICKFIVSLTRAKKSCTLVPNREYNYELQRSVDSPSIFIGMLPQDKLLKQEYRIKKGQLQLEGQ